MFTKCEKCGKTFQTYPCRIKEGRDRFCSNVCNKEARVKNLELGAEFRFKPGHQRPSRIDTPKGANHKKWKGENVGYRGMHYWVRRQKGAPQRCDHCGTTKSVQWANIDHSYPRNPDDYFPLCASCHKKYDLKMRKS